MLLATSQPDHRAVRNLRLEVQSRLVAIAAETRPNQSWHDWLWWLLRQRLKDRQRELDERLREREFSWLESLAASSECGVTPDDGELPRRKPAATPAIQAEQAQYRGRQLKLLSDVFREFCREHETTPAGRKRKEIFERGLRGQKRSEIVARMGVPRGTVDRYMGEAYDWIYDRALQADVNRSVFLTLQRRRRENAS